MDLIVLNTNLDAVSIVDVYESFIWTDRYYEYGDFELFTSMTSTILSYIRHLLLPYTQTRCHLLQAETSQLLYPGSLEYWLFFRFGEG